MSEILTENKLRNKVNHLRQQQDQKERELRKIFRELELHKTNTTKLKEQRDHLNLYVKELSQKASIQRNHRDTINKQITNLKHRRENLKLQTQKGNLDALKEERDALNKISKGTHETLLRFYSEELETFKTSDIPLEHEINIFNKLRELKTRIEAAEQANQKHEKLQQKYKNNKKIHKELDIIHNRIQALAEDSQKYHEQLMENYKKIDTIRKESDEYHKNLIEIYNATNPIRSKIDPLKKSLKEIREELNIYLEQQKETQLKKDEAKNEEKRIDAKKRYQKTGKMSLEDLRILIENKELKL